MKCISVSRDELLDDLPGHGEVEGPGLLPRRDDLVGREEEAVHPGVPQFHPIAVGDAQLTQCPVQRPTTGYIEHAGDTADIVGLLVDGVEGGITDLGNPEQDTLELETEAGDIPVEVVNIGGLVVGPAPGEEDELTVGVEVVVKLDSVLHWYIVLCTCTL